MIAPAANAFEAPRVWERLGFRPDSVFRVIGMRRSGNNAIIHWLQRNSRNGRSLFLNNCKRGKDPLTHFATMEIDGVRAPHRKARRNLARACSPVGDGALLVFSHEDNSPLEYSIDNPISGPFDERLVDRDIYVYRSFLNWIASLTQKLREVENYSDVRRSSILLRSAEIYTGILQQVARADTLGITPVCYDDWVSDADYRCRVLEQLDLPERDNSLGHVQPYGGGSSFQKDVQSVDLLETDKRWLQMLDDPEYQAVLHLAARDEALTEAVARFFPRDARILERVARQTPLSQEVYQ